MAEPFFRMMEFLVPSVMTVNGTKITYQGLENIPARGGGLIALNHTTGFPRRSPPTNVGAGFGS